MKKSLFILGIVLLLCVSLASAVLTDADGSYSFNNAVVPFQDDSGNGNTITSYSGVTRTLISGSNYGYLFNGASSNYIDVPSIISTSDFSISFWINTSDNNGDGILSSSTNHNYGSADRSDFMIYFDSSGNVRLLYDNSGSADQLQGNSLNTNTWQHIVLTYDDSLNQFKLYQDTTNSISTTASTYNFGTMGLRLGTYYYNAWGQYYSGMQDQVIVYNRVLTTSEISELYNLGVIYDPYDEINITINDSTESTVNVKQVGSVSFGGGGLTNIVSSDFNVSLNNTPVYGGYTFEIESNGDNEVFCELFIYNQSVANITRSQTAGQKGTASIVHPVLIVEDGPYTQTLRCERTSGVGLTTISNAVGIGHFLYNQDEEILPYNDTSIDLTVTSGTDFTLLDSFNITIGNKTEVEETQNRTNHLIIEGSLQYTNNDISNENLEAYLNINGTNCTIYPRYVSSTSTGSVGIDCILQNVTSNATYTINVYGNGTNANYVGDIVAKNFFMTPGEIVGGTGIITGYTFSDSGYQAVFNSSGGNFNHDEANAFVKLSYSILTDLDTTVSFYVVVSDGQTFTTNTWSRDFTAGETGVIIGQDFIESLPKDPNYNITLFADCGTVGANCTIVGGSSLGYMTDVITTVLNAFNVSAFDYWDNSSISNFTVIDGGIYNTETGSALVFTENELENLTISSTGYFDTVILNHNSSLNLNVSLRQSDIKFAAYEIGSNNSITGTTFTIENVSKSTNESFYLKAGSYNVTVSGGGYYPRTQAITVAALDNKTINFDGNNGLGNTIFNITARDFYSNATINDFSVIVVSNESYSYTFEETTTNGYVEVIGLQNDSYILNLSSTGAQYASTNNQALYNDDNYTLYTYYLFNFNSVRINIYDYVTMNLITQNVDIKTISETESFENTTNTGTIVIDFLTPVEYELRFNATNYASISKFITVLNDSTQEVNVYMVKNATTDVQVVQVVDTSNTAVEGAIIWLQKETIGVSGNFLTVQESQTNSEGKTSVFVERDTSVFYRFAVFVDGEAKPIQPSGNTYTTKTSFIPGVTETIVLIVDLESTTATEIENRLSVTTDLFNTSQYDYEFTWTDGRNAVTGARLVVRGKYLDQNITYETLYNVSALGSSGSLTYTVPNINNTIFELTGYLIYADSEVPVEQEIHVNEPDVIVDKNTGLLLAVVFLLFVAFITVRWGILISAILTPTSMFVMIFFNFIHLPEALITSLIALAIILFISNKKKSEVI